MIKEKTTEEPKTQKRRQKNESKGLWYKWRNRRRKLPIIVRIIIALILFALSLAAGLMFGYGILGDGAMMDVFEKETWQHIVDIVKLEK